MADFHRAAVAETTIAIRCIGARAFKSQQSVIARLRALPSPTRAAPRFNSNSNGARAVRASNQRTTINEPSDNFHELITLKSYHPLVWTLSGTNRAIGDRVRPLGVGTIRSSCHTPGGHCPREYTRW